MFCVGDIFFSATGLIRCFSQPIARRGADGLLVAGCDHKQLVPNTFAPSIQHRVGMQPVWDGSQKVGQVNCLNHSDDRENSYWKVVDVVVHGCGMTSEQEQELRWAKYDCLAIRVTATGACHPSGESVRFSNAGPYYVADLVRQDIAA